MVQVTCQRLPIVAESEMRAKRFKSQVSIVSAASHKEAQCLGRDHYVSEVGHICLNCNNV